MSPTLEQNRLSLSVAGGQLVIVGNAGDVRAEFWVCGLVKTRLGRETADVKLTLAPEVSGPIR